MSDPEIQRFLGNLQSSLVGFITSEWVDLVPAIVGNLIPAACALPPGNSLTEGYDAPTPSPSAAIRPIPTTATILPVPAVPAITASAPALPSVSRVRHSASIGSTLLQPVPPPSRGLSSGFTQPPLTILSQEVGQPRSLLPTQIIIRPTESGTPIGLTSAVATSSATTSMRPAKRTKRTKIVTHSSVPTATDLMPKNKVPPSYIRVHLWFLLL